MTACQSLYIHMILASNGFISIKVVWAQRHQTRTRRKSWSSTRALSATWWGSVGLKSRCPAAGQGPATKETLLCAGVGTPLQSTYPLSRIRNILRLSACRTRIKCSMCYCRYHFRVSSCVLMVCPCGQIYRTQMLSLAPGWAWAHQTLSQPGRR